MAGITVKDWVKAELHGGKDEAQSKDRQVAVRLTPEEYKLLEAIARRLKRSVTNCGRELLISAMKEAEEAIAAEMNGVV